MSILNFFRRKKQDKQPETQTPVMDSNQTLIDKQLFVDENSPLDLPLPVKKNAVEEILNRDHSWAGYNDGYAHPDKDFMDQKIAALSAEFRLALDKLMNTLREEVGELRLHLIDIEGISPRMEAKVNERLRQTEVNIHELDTQKILSGEGEGMLASCTQAYKLGFIRGLERYQQEKIFGETTGLFNN